MMAQTVDSAELWQRVDHLQEWVEELRGDLTDASLLQQTAEDFGKTFATICVLSSHFEDW